jgi:hypothetical protein
MTESKTALTRLFSPLADDGFRKKGMVWCRSGEDTLFSFELQKSRNGDRYFINVGVLFHSLEAGDHRPPHQCHFYGRFGEDTVLSCLDFETVPADDRIDVLTQFRDHILLPAAERCSTTQGAAAFFSSAALRVPLVLPAARAILGLDA